MADQAFGRYHIIRELGKGGMASVYLGHDPSFDREVAIKVLPREVMIDSTFRLRFTQEARTVANLGHPAIVPVFDFGEHDGQPYLVMAYMTGGSLADALQSGPLPDAGSVSTLERVAEALDAAHAAGIIHRDVKPANILYDKFGYAFLSDFGIVKLNEATAHLTGTGVVGTPAYMAPEMVDEGGLSKLVDVYALAVTLFQVLTGIQPYRADTPIGVLMAHMNKPIPDIRALRPDLPEAVRAVIETGMAKNPAERYQTAGALTAGLRRALGPELGKQTLVQALPIEQTLIDLPDTLQMERQAAYEAEAARIAEEQRLAREAEAARIDEEQRLAREAAEAASSDPYSTLYEQGKASWEAPLPAPAAIEGSPAEQPLSQPRPRRRVGCISAALLGLIVGGVALAWLLTQGTALTEGLAGLTGGAAATAGPGPSPTLAPAALAQVGMLAYSVEIDGNEDIYVMHADGSGQINLSNRPARDTNPDWSPDGSQLAFFSYSASADLPDELWLVQPDGSGLQLLQSAEDSFWEMDWSPDGQVIAVSDGNYLRGINLDGSEAWRTNMFPLLGQFAFLDAIAYAPNGNLIAFADGSTVGVLSPTGYYEILASTAQGFYVDWEDDETLIYTDSPEDDIIWLRVMVGQPFESTEVAREDGQLLEYQRNRLVAADGEHRLQLSYNENDLWSLEISGPATGGEARVILSDMEQFSLGGFQPEQAASAEGSATSSGAEVDLSDDLEGAFVFASNRDGDYDLYGADLWPPSVHATEIPNLATAVPTETWDELGLIVLSAGFGIPVTSLPGDETEPMYSPDGNYLVFTYEINGNKDLYLLNPDGSTRQLTYDSGHQEGAVWSPDGQWIAYLNSVDGDYDIYVMGADGSGQRALTFDRDSSGDRPWNNRNPVWSPDSSRIAFVDGGTYSIHIVTLDGVRADTGKKRGGVTNWPMWTGINTVTVSGMPPAERSSGGYLLDSDLIDGFYDLILYIGGQRFNLTDSPDVSEKDPAWRP